jgi:hypothetical protein
MAVPVELELRRLSQVQVLFVLAVVVALVVLLAVLAVLAVAVLEPLNQVFLELRTLVEVAVGYSTPFQVATVAQVS